MTHVRHKFYLLDEIVEFYPIEHMLHSKTNDAKVSLLASASECLVCLLENHGSLVTKKELIHTGWEQYNLHVSDSTFNQNIFTLRKALKECGLCHDVIKTIPRKGLVIPETINITKVNNNTPQTNGIFNVENNQKDITQEVKTTRIYFNTLNKLNLQKGGKLMLIYISCISGVILGGYFSIPKDYINFYKTSFNENNCHLQIDSQRSSIVDFNKFRSSADFECKKNEVIYFSTYKNVPRVSVIRCGNEFSSQYNNCASWYYLDKKS